jgi:hypothetical protein
MRVSHLPPRSAVRSLIVGGSVVLLCVALSGVAQAGITRPFSPSSTIQLAPGISYQKGTMRTTGGSPQSVRVATVDPEHPGVRLRSLLSNDLVIKRELPSRLAQRKSNATQRAMVATNGDMSTAQRQDAYAAPQGMHVQGGELMVAQACTRPTLGISSSGKAHIGEVRVHVSLYGGRFRQPRQVHRVNTHRDDGHVVLFTRRFASSTRTRAGGIEVVLDLSDTLRPSGTQEVRVVRVRRGGGDTELNVGHAVLSLKGSGSDWVRELREGDRYTLQTQVVRKVHSRCGGTPREAEGWGDIVEAVGGNHFTARGGKVSAPSRSLYPTGSQRHPRTNVGVTADGRVLMVTIDGRQRGYSVGVTLAEAGRLMVSLGARQAFNMDGGGSTLMARRSLSTEKFEVANRPSDGRERPATQALAAFEVLQP